MVHQTSSHQTESGPIWGRLKVYASLDERLQTRVLFTLRLLPCNDKLYALLNAVTQRNTNARHYSPGDLYTTLTPVSKHSRTKLKHGK